MKHLSVTIFIFCLLFAQITFAQNRPFITGFTPSSVATGEEVLVTGYNLPTSNAKVTVGGVEATITGTSTASSITFLMPANTGSGLITVLNKSTRLSGTSSKMILNSFGGGDFDETFITATPNFASSQSELYDLIAADFDGDNKVDIVSTDNGGALISIFMNTSSVGSISFSESTIQNNQNKNNRNGAAGDLDGDGKPDFALTEGGSSNPHIYIFKNTSLSPGNIGFNNSVSIELPKLITPTDTVVRLAERVDIKDIDGDGKKDIIANCFNEGIFFVYPNTSSGGTISFDTPVEVKVGTNSAGLRGLEVKDLNEDGLPEVITSDISGNNIYISENQSIVDETSSVKNKIQFKEEISLKSLSEPVTLKLADLDGDNKAEIIVTSLSAPFDETLGVHQNTSGVNNKISFSSAKKFKDIGSLWGVDIGDINGDGKADIVTADSRSGQRNFTILINNSTDSDIDFTNHTMSTTGGTRNIKVVDVDGNGKAEILLAESPATGQTKSPELIVINNSHCQVPVLDLSADLTKLCGSASQEIGVSSLPGTTYQWEKSALITSPVFSDLTGDTNSKLTVDSEGIYRVIVKSTGCEKTSNTLSFSGSASPLPSTPTINSIPPVICKGDNISLSVPPAAGISHVWIKPDKSDTTTNTLALDSIQATQSGEYLVYAIDDASSCRSEPDKENILVNTLPSILISTSSSSLFCAGETIDLESQSYAAFSYAWLTDSVANGTTSKNSLMVTETGKYQLIITDPVSGCKESSNELSFTKASKPDLNIIAPDSSCINTLTSFTSNINSQEPGLNIVRSWNFGDSNTSTQEEPTNIFTSAANFTVSLVTAYQELTTCFGTTTKNISIVDIPTTKISVKDLLGQEDSTSKCPSDTLALSIENGLANYIWTSSTGNDTISTTNTVQVIQASKYLVSAVNSINCTVIDSVEITDLANSGIDIRFGDEVRNDQTITLTDDDLDVSLTAARGSKYMWSPAERFDKPESDSTGVYPRGDLRITLSGVDTNGCPDSATVDIVDPRVLEEKSLSLSGFNGDNCWEIANKASLTSQGCSITIFDNKGKNILSSSFNGLADNGEVNCVWKGESQGASVIPGIYYYVIKCPTSANSNSGSIIVVQ